MSSEGSGCSSHRGFWKVGWVSGRKPRPQPHGAAPLVPFVTEEVGDQGVIVCLWPWNPPCLRPRLAVQASENCYVQAAPGNPALWGLRFLTGGSSGLL